MSEYPADVICPMCGGNDEQGCYSDCPSNRPEGVIEEIAAERKRQIEQEGWTTTHDDEHEEGVLARAGACYALLSTQIGREAIYTHGKWQDILDLYWPWSREWWKPKDRRRDLIRAAALIVAEIERMDRLSPKAQP